MPTENTPLLQDQENQDSQAQPSIPPSSQSQNVPSQPHSTFARRLTATSAFTLLISIIIGSGIFSSPGPIDANVPSPGAALLTWLVGGIVAWTGALTMAELGTLFPGPGGIQPYLSHMYGEVFGFLAAWSWVVATMPATLAILSVAFVESVYSSLGVNDAAPGVVHKLWGLLVVGTVTVLNSISTRTSTRLGSFFVGVKFLSVFLLIVAGVAAVGVFVTRGRDLGGGDWHQRGWFEKRETVLPDGGTIRWEEVGVWESLGFYSTALYGALWAYSGWDKANYVAAELKNPRKQLPLAINTAIPTIIVCYVAANAVYYVLLPWKVVSITDAAAVTAVTHFLGKTVAYIATFLICLVIAGSALGNSFVAGRMTVAAANKGWIPAVFGTVGQIGPFKISHHLRSSKDASNADASSASSPTLIDQSDDDTSDEDALDRGDSPINALLLNFLLSAIYILLFPMRTLLTLNGLAEYFFFFLTVLGAIVLRFREPDLERPVKPSIVVPGVFCVISGFVVVRGAVGEVLQAGVLVGVWALGGVWWAVRGRRGRD